MLRALRLAAIISIAVVGIAALTACGGSSSGAAPAVTSTITLPLGESGTPLPANHPGIANTLDAAIYKAKGFIASASPLASAHPSSFNYVETTLGQARALFPLNIRDFAQPDWSGQGKVTPYADGAPVWAFVASGQFVSYDRLFGTTSTYTTAWIVIAEGQPGIFENYDNAQYDLTALGTVQQVPGPIPTVTSRYDLTMTPPPMDTPPPTS